MSRAYEGNLYPVAELAHSIGVTPESAREWFRRRRLKITKRGGRNHVSPNAADSYLNHWGYERVAKRPKGWLTVKAVLDCGVGRMTLIKAVQAGRVRAVMHRKSIYLEPEDARHFMLEYSTLRPLSGWVLVPVPRDELGVSKEALNQWIRRNKIPTRRFLHPTRNRPTPYLKGADADTYRQLVATGSVKHKGHVYKGGVHSEELVRTAVEHSGPDGVTAKEVAEATGVCHDTCRDTLRKLYRSGELSRSGPGTWKEHFRFYVPLQEAA